MSARKTIVDALVGRQKPSRIVVPHSLYWEFIRENNADGVPDTVWGIQVEPGQVDTITFIMALTPKKGYKTT